ncbi:MAG TPA: MerR family transcriptional regulator [bacterium]|nr:MerR family transcriptional regulator [bacterium]
MTIQEVGAVVMQDDLPIYPIRTVASLTGVDARRLRSWESEYHLLEPARSKGGHRLYSPRDLRLVHLIRRLVDQEGMSLQGIKAFLAVQPDIDGGATGTPPAGGTPLQTAGAGVGTATVPLAARSHNGHGRTGRG